ncbi:MAG: pyrophosphatase PpaX [Patescibacteria group bacterium]|jgi:phosphoglycolate phosphatase-like HAD superfamily hydrolase|nr:pyrophosphatase PpaX [Patescibacteria group bacterium]
MSKIKAIISDADGTLVNTLYLIRHGQYETAKTYLTQHGVPIKHIPSYEEYEKHLHTVLGGSARETLERTIKLIYEEIPEHIEGIDYDVLHDMLNPIQDKIAPEYVKAYPGLENLLKTLGKKKIDLAIFTSGTPHHVVRNFGIAIPELELTSLFTEDNRTDLEKMHMLEQKMEQYFNIPKMIFITCDDITANKPDPESILVALDRLSKSKEDALVLGDHKVDIQAGMNAGIPTRVGVSHGFDDVDALKKAGATQVIHSLEEIPTLL